MGRTEKYSLLTTDSVLRPPLQKQLLQRRPRVMTLLRVQFSRPPSQQ